MSRRGTTGIWKWAALATFAFTSLSCSVGEGWLPGSMAAASNNQIMLVRSQPASFGYQRLTNQSGVYPDLGVFISQKGLPDFLAETHNKDRHYFILYYLNHREAYACRTPAARTRRVEFAGPYPITDREYRVLDGFRKESARQAKRG